MITDLTEGKISRSLWAFSIPMLISVMFQQIYNIADSVIAGKFISEDALAAVGASYPITMIFIAVAIGSNIGCSVIISQLFGAKKYGDMKTAISTTFIACAVLSITLTILGFAFSSPLLHLINTPQNIFHDSSLYLNIYIGGLTFLFLYNICTGIFNALGDSRTPLYFLIGSSLGNIILALLFVINYHFGVAGVAWATFVAQGISSLLSLIALFIRMKRIRTTEKSTLFSGLMLKKISMIAIPSILQQSFISIGNILVQGLINGYGSAVIAGYSAAIKLNTFAITSYTTLANGLSSFTAQNIGAAKPERVKKGFSAGVFMTLLISIPFFILFFFFNDTMLKIFISSESQVAIDTGRMFLKIVSPFYYIISIKLMADGVLRGAGAMKYFMISTFTDLVLRIILSFLLSPHFGTNGIWVSWPIGWAVATILSAVFYFMGEWKKESLI